MSRKSALVSIHDVMPSTLPQVRKIHRFLHALNVHALTLLVVPGKDWTDSQITQLQKWQDEGIELAGHGWEHHITGKKGIWHSLHAQIISRDEAEHLSRSRQEIAEIISCSYDWFQQAGLAKPLLYVPPVWSKGSMPDQDLFRLPYALHETLTGVFDVQNNTYRYMPLTGYMADTHIRTLCLKVLNAVNLALPGGPVRIAIHPNDLHYPLKADLSRHLARFDQFLTYYDIIVGDDDE